MDEIFELKWHEQKSSLSEVAGDLFSNGALVDCALVAEGRLVDVHKIVLYACSPYLRTLLNHPLNFRHQGYPLVILKDVSYEDLLLLIDYMYKGVVRLPRKNFDSFLAAADFLQIRGLTGSSGQMKSPPPKPQPAQPEKAPSQEFLEPPRLTPETYPESNVSSSSLKSSQLATGCAYPPKGTTTTVSHSEQTTCTTVTSLTVTKRSYSRKPKVTSPTPPVAEPPKVVKPSVIVNVEDSLDLTLNQVDLTQDDDDDDEPPPKAQNNIKVVTIGTNEAKKFAKEKETPKLPETRPVNFVARSGAVENAVKSGNHVAIQSRVKNHNVANVSSVANKNDGTIGSSVDNRNATLPVDAQSADGRRLTRSSRMSRRDKFGSELKMDSFIDLSSSTPPKLLKGCRKKPGRKPTKSCPTSADDRAADELLGSSRTGSQIGDRVNESPPARSRPVSQQTDIRTTASRMESPVNGSQIEERGPNLPMGIRGQSATPSTSYSHAERMARPECTKNAPAQPVRKRTPVVKKQKEVFSSTPIAGDGRTDNYAARLPTDDRTNEPRLTDRTPHLPIDIHNPLTPMDIPYDISFAQDIEIANGRQLRNRKRSCSNWSLYGPTLYQKKRTTRRKRSSLKDPASNVHLFDTSPLPTSSRTFEVEAKTVPSVHQATMMSARTDTESSIESSSTNTSSYPAAI